MLIRCIKDLSGRWAVTRKVCPHSHELGPLPWKEQHCAFQSFILAYGIHSGITVTCHAQAHARASALFVYAQAYA